MTTFTWTFPKAQRAVSLNGLSNVITTVYWRYRGTDDNGTTAEIYGALSVGEPNREEFIPWDQVTTSEVQTWVENIFNQDPLVDDEQVDGETPLTQLDKMQETIQQKIDLLNNPTTITEPLEG